MRVEPDFFTSLQPDLPMMMGERAAFADKVYPAVPDAAGSVWFNTGKRAFDIFFSLVALPGVLTVCGVVWLLNFAFNRGPLFYQQQRMGKGGIPFTAIKLRTMKPATNVARGPYDGVEIDRITRLGHVLRRFRVDELPQLWNVLVGDMSVVGPRPDYIGFARDYIDQVPGYRHRLLVRPGITGLAQVRGGYAACSDSIARKAALDLEYIRNLGWMQEARIILATIRVVLTGFGAR